MRAERTGNNWAMCIFHEHVMRPYARTVQRARDSVQPDPVNMLQILELFFGRNLANRKEFKVAEILNVRKILEFNL